MTGGGFNFPAYLKEILDRGTGASRCRDSEGAESGICRLKIRRGTEQNLVKMDRQLKGIKTMSIGAENLWKFTRNFCLGLEIWGRNLEETEAAVYSMKEKPCLPTRTGYGRSGVVDMDACPIHIDKLTWSSFQTQRDLWNTQEKDMTMAVCMDVVFMIITEFQLYGRQGDSGIQTHRDQPCQSLYIKLKEWGGEEIAARIMREWFTSNERGGGGTRAFTLQGRDFYEVLSEFMWGDHHGDKNLRCTAVFDGERNPKQVVSYYKTENSEDSGGFSCEKGGGLCRLLHQYQENLGKDSTRDADQVLEAVFKDHAHHNSPGPTSSSATEESQLGPAKDQWKSTGGELSSVKGALFPESNGGGVGMVPGIIGGVISGLLGLLGVFGYYRIMFSGRRTGRGELTQGIGYGFRREG
ncbi:hypothetical protein C922_05288 [Plasmodium inui San Antonio 1]|uniref:Uncharacterized protein n=1 Tax=Plasmodium inui San Antonio 1 TaxID=1237626 RepID=W7A5H1_9APIC|nr:hypothetical protein C922_05288 [Plasmodium inui San Antonio 1]EUD64329.1 hypothetical protein C922_05288 [Plasmodium inui San Antonio 1]